MTDGRAEVHDEDPFRDPLDKRTPGRRLRGRLVAPVTIWTAGAEADRTGLTVSSILLAEGDPSLVLGLISDTTDLWEQIEATGRFVVHVLGEKDRILAERFAGLRPSPGGLFEGLATTPSPSGPIIDALQTRAGCEFTGASQEGFHRLVRGRLDRSELGDSGDPLVHYRGRYRKLTEDDRA
jgi:flavin reductase (DIM6/NTAB) family NADH-FMN oxidoreductase RutF